MIAERAATCLLALVCVFQALSPLPISPQSWQSIDLRIGWFRMQAKNGADSLCFRASPGGACSSQRSISLPPVRQRDLEGLSICITKCDCMTAWVDRSSHEWSISRSAGANFERNVIDLDGRGIPNRGD